MKEFSEELVMRYSVWREARQKWGLFSPEEQSAFSELQQVRLQEGNC